MGIEELALLVAGQQFAMAVAAYLAKIGPAATSPFGSAACAVGAQLAKNAATACAAGITAASSELSNVQSNESTVALVLMSLPPIS